jgi:hypothetical protein
LDDFIQHIALLVDGPPEETLLTIDGDDHFIEVARYRAG